MSNIGCLTKKSAFPYPKITFLLCSVLMMPASVLAGTTVRASVQNDGSQFAATAYADATISADGRYVAFRATPYSGSESIYVRDMSASTTVQVASGAFLSISPNGRYLAFSSGDSNLVDNDTNSTVDVFVRDMTLGTFERVSMSNSGEQANGYSSVSRLRAISDDGRYVVFESSATNLVSGDINGKTDVFVRDRQTGTTELVSVASNGTQANDNCRYAVISGDGRYVAFSSQATNLSASDTFYTIDVFVHDRVTHTTKMITHGNGISGSSWIDISADGRYIAFHSDDNTLVPGDTNGKRDVFVADQISNTIQRVNVATDGSQSTVGLSPTNWPSLSPDGRYVLFSDGGQLVPEDTDANVDVYMRDRIANTTTRVNIASDGTPANAGISTADALARYGQVAVFTTWAGNLVTGDTNNQYDVFVRTACPQ